MVAGPDGRGPVKAKIQLPGLHPHCLRFPPLFSRLFPAPASIRLSAVRSVPFLVSIPSPALDSGLDPPPVGPLGMPLTPRAEVLVRGGVQHRPHPGGPRGGEARGHQAPAPTHPSGSVSERRGGGTTATTCLHAGTAARCATSGLSPPTRDPRFPYVHSCNHTQYQCNPSRLIWFADPSVRPRSLPPYITGQVSVMCFFLPNPPAMPPRNVWVSVSGHDALRFDGNLGILGLL